MNVHRVAILVLLAFVAGLWPAGAFAGSSQPSRGSTFSSGSTTSSGGGFKASSPSSRANSGSGFKATSPSSTPRTGTSANPMAPGGKLTGQFKSATSRTTVGNNTGVRTPVSGGQTGKGGKAAGGPGENQVKKPSGLIADSKPPSQTRSNRRP
jgi:hypothetical protein